ncbi:hypothetical protein BHM03_00011856 [Ensete ventricosum]|nr:hypothetical protein BHM03_00011856 [Ensete ventricosum]
MVFLSRNHNHLVFGRELLQLSGLCCTTTFPLPPIAAFEINGGVLQEAIAGLPRRPCRGSLVQNLLPYRSWLPITCCSQSTSVFSTKIEHPFRQHTQQIPAAFFSVADHISFLLASSILSERRHLEGLGHITAGPIAIFFLYYSSAALPHCSLTCRSSRLPH